MCGIIGVSGIADAARLTYLGLYALQHRGQESAGIVVVDRQGNARAHQAAMDKFNGIHRLAETLCPDQIEIAHHPDDVQRIQDAGKLVAIIGMENGYVIGNDLALLETYYDLGGRYMTLAHTSHNDIADSANPPEPEHNGLTAFGEQVVAEMNRLGMMVDVSHISKAAALAAMREEERW